MTGEARRPARSGREREAIGLTIFGFSGIILIALAVVLVIAGFQGLAGTVETLQAGTPGGLAQRLDRVAMSLDQAQLALASIDTTLDSTAQSARDGQRLGTSLASSLRALSTALDVEVLGSRPFADAGDQFRTVAADADALAGDLEITAGGLDANRVALQGLANEVADLRTEVTELRDELAASSSSDAGTGGLAPTTTIGLAEVVLVALLAWFAVPALVASTVGVRRLRASQRERYAASR